MVFNMAWKQDFFHGSDVQDNPLKKVPLIFDFGCLFIHSSINAINLYRKQENEQTEES